MNNGTTQTQAFVARYFFIPVDIVTCGCQDH